MGNNNEKEAPNEGGEVNLQAQVTEVIARYRDQVEKMEKQKEAFSKEMVSLREQAKQAVERKDTNAAKRLLQQKKQCESKVEMLDKQIVTLNSQIFQMENASNITEQKDLMESYEVVYKQLAKQAEGFQDVVDRIADHADTIAEAQSVFDNAYADIEGDPEIDAELQNLEKEVEDEKNHQQQMEYMRAQQAMPSVPSQTLTEEEQIRKELGMGPAEANKEDDAALAALQSEFGL